jgi:carbohydrate kinase (thermoresistant glucokinase family)
MSKPVEPSPAIILLMGVSGCGKSTTGHALSQRLGWEFRDADSFHPPANVAKMSSGVPLTDDDRWPWLDAIGRWIDERSALRQPGIVSCSALKRIYRDRLLRDRANVSLVFLQGPFELIDTRLNRRQGHFMPRGLLESQFRTLEEPDETERPLVVPIHLPPHMVAAHIMDRLGLSPQVAVAPTGRIKG